MEQLKQGILICIITFTFWGALYPQFSLVEESYECIYGEKNPKEDFYAILDAQKGEIILKSKFVEILRDWNYDIDKDRKMPTKCMAKE